MIYLCESIETDNRAAAHSLLLRGLREEYGITAPLSFTYGPNGKPYLAEYPHIFFNISHCRTGAACVLSDREVGIDIQDTRSFTHRAAKRVCTEDELARLEASDKPEKLFCRLWAVKEAYVKLHGGSIMGGIVDTEAALAAAGDDVLLREEPEYMLCCFGVPPLTVVMVGRDENA